MASPVTDLAQCESSSSSSGGKHLRITSSLLSLFFLGLFFSFLSYLIPSLSLILSKAFSIYHQLFPYPLFFSARHPASVRHFCFFSSPPFPLGFFSYSSASSSPHLFTLTSDTAFVRLTATLLNYDNHRPRQYEASQRPPYLSVFSALLVVFF